jgi:hypothetical protein
MNDDRRERIASILLRLFELTDDNEFDDLEKLIIGFRRPPPRS